MTTIRNLMIDLVDRVELRLSWQTVDLLNRAIERPGAAFALSSGLGPYNFDGFSVSLGPNDVDLLDALVAEGERLQPLGETEDGYRVTVTDGPTDNYDRRVELVATAGVGYGSTSIVFTVSG